ncbi:MAG: DinB family protein [Rhodococcus sp.]|nr:DinB family protein [Rhodococcus sp. (in: high G+C Gram-positive bacteria)]
MNAGERETLEGWLDFHRSTLARKCEGLTDDQAVTASAPPSGFTLIGLVQHLAEVERNWFRRVLGEEVPPVHPDQPNGMTGGFAVPAGTTLASALGTWQSEVEAARAASAGRELTDLGTIHGQPVSLRWIYVHMIEEYARHNGHADLLRERIDGTTGV